MQNASHSFQAWLKGAVVRKSPAVQRRPKVLRRSNRRVSTCDLPASPSFTKVCVLEAFFANPRKRAFRSAASHLQNAACTLQSETISCRMRQANLHRKVFPSVPYVQQDGLTHLPCSVYHAVHHRRRWRSERRSRSRGTASTYPARGAARLASHLSWRAEPFDQLHGEEQLPTRFLHDKLETAHGVITIKAL